MGLELHFHESIVSLDRSGSEATEREEPSEGDTEGAGETGGGGGAAVAALLALVALVAIAFAVRRLRGGEEADGEAEIEIDE